MTPTQQQLTNPSFLQKLALDLIRSRKSNYLEDCIYYYFQQTKFILQDIPDIKNKYNHQLKCTYVKHRLTLLEKVQQDFLLNNKSNKNTINQKCIIYLHGLGSNRIQGFSLLPHLPKNYSLLSFDLSGSGKSQGDFTTYGFRQQEDIQAILTYLYKKKNIRQFIIWGRSMGAVASLLFNNTMAEKQAETLSTEQVFQNNQHYQNQSTLYKCVKCIIADSPFSSFQQISKDIALKKMSIPTFFTDIALKFLQNSFDKLLYDKNVKKNFTPFQIDFTKSSLKPVVPIIFVYSLNDQIVTCLHSENIIKSVQKNKCKFIEKIIMPQCGHNLKRPQNVIQAIFQKIQKHCQLTENINLICDSKTNRISGQYSVDKKTESIHQQTKSVRRKSFWNFQQQISDQNQPSKIDILQSTIIPPNNSHQKNKFSESKEFNQNTTVRKSIFDRDQKHSSKINLSTTKKRGLSLSSTIQRIQAPTNQVNLTEDQISKIKIKKHQTLNDNCAFVRAYSMQGRQSSGKINNQQSKISPRKGIVRCNAQLMNSNFQKSTRNRPSLGGNKTKIPLGGSIQKKNKLAMNGFKANIYNKSSRQNSQVQMAPERDSNISNDLSSISYSDKIIPELVGFSKRFQTINLSKKKQILKKCLGQSFESQPNIMNQEENQFKRISSRQSLNTIDAGQLSNDVDQTLTSFINTKLQFNVQLYALHNEGVFNKYKTIELGGANSKINKTKQSQILSQLDIKQMTQLTQTTNKFSTISMPSHISLRPSSRLYHEKRKKKLQAQTIFFNKQNQNVKITNQRYLFDD